MAIRRPQKKGPLKERSDNFSVNCSITARNLNKSELGGVIFGCTHETQDECFSRKLFGLPSTHYAYVKKVVPGMPLFLFNYMDRKLHGIFEATTFGQLKLDPYGWIDDKSKETPFPAQVGIKFRMQCMPLIENQYKSIIENNYYEPPKLFWFELDRDQTEGLITLFSSNPFIARSPRIHNNQWQENTKQTLPANGHSVSNIPSSSGTAVIYNELEPHMVGKSFLDALGLGGGQPSKTWSSLFKTSPALTSENSLEGLNKSGVDLSPPLSTLSLDSFSSWLDGEKQVFQERDEVPECWETDVRTVENGLLRYDVSLETDIMTNENGLQDNSETYVDNFVQCDVPECWESLDLTNLSLVPDSSINSQNCAPDVESVIADVESVITKLLRITNDIAASQFETKEISSLEHDLVESKQEIHQLKVRNMIASHHESIYIVGGYDGKSWSSDLNLYSPSRDSMKSLQRMSFVRLYASAVKMTDGLFVLGGLNNNMSFNTVELYKPINNQWVGFPSMNLEKGFVGAISLNNHLYAIGGGNMDSCFSHVEVLDPIVGSWVFIQPMLEKRYTPAVAEINGVLYVAGGYDGSTCLKSVERLDPRESRWAKIAAMSEKRAFHNLAVLNEKLYAVGGYDATNMHSSVEVLDPRFGIWMTADPMHSSRGNFGSVTIGKKIYAIGGLSKDDEFVNTVECYTEYRGWEVTELDGIGNRCDFSAVLASI